MTSEAGSRLRRFAQRLRHDPDGPGHGRSGSEPVTEAGPQRGVDARLAHVVPIGQALPRERVTVVGEVRILALRPQGDVPALDVELWDGADALHLVWLGRRSIPGISAGTRLRATGRVTLQRRSKTIFNPAYEVIGTARGPHG